MPRLRIFPGRVMTNKVTVAVTDELKQEFEEACAADGISPSEYVRRCILQLVEKHQDRIDGNDSSDSMQMVS
jgi:metal-responsive CopG/Arc/MetJ family transcriptional regulator